MSYRDTARRYIAADRETRAGFTPTPATLGADKLPLPPFADRADLSPRSIAGMHAEHVEGLAAKLREVLGDEPEKDWMMHGQDAAAVGKAARALLAAIGEAE